MSPPDKILATSMPLFNYLLKNFSVIDSISQYSGVAGIFLRDHRPLKGYHLSPQRVLVAPAPDGTDAWNFKMNWENEFIFQKFQHFLAPKNIFLKNLKKEDIFRQFVIVRRLFLKISDFQFFWNLLTNPENFPMKWIIHLRNLLNSSSKFPQIKKQLLESWKFFQILQNIDCNLWKNSK